MNGIRFISSGRCVPAHILTNGDLAKTVDTDEEWITTRTGIRERRICTTETHADLCREAAAQALKKAGISPEEIGACIVATSTAQTVVPAASCRLQKELGLPSDIPCFDMNAACTGFVFALHTIECLLNASPRKYGLVVGCETLSRVVDWNDRSTCILFGDGAGACIVECSEGWPSIGAVLGTDGNDEILVLPGLETGEHSYLSMEGTKVFKFAVSAVPKCIDEVLHKNGCTIDDIDYFVFHQANARIIDSVVRRYKIPEEKYCKNIHRYGNTSAASIGLVLSELEDEGKLPSGSRVLMVGFGGGLTWGGAIIRIA